MANKDKVEWFDVIVQIIIGIVMFIAVVVISYTVHADEEQEENYCPVYYEAYMEAYCEEMKKHSKYTHCVPPPPPQCYVGKYPSYIDAKYKGTMDGQARYPK